MVNLDLNFSKGLSKVTSAAISLVSYAQSDVGKKRARNEDNYAVMTNEKLFIVADGMGGHAGGETASRIAVATVGAVIQNHADVLAAAKSDIDDLEASPVAQLLSDAVRGACHEIHHEASVNAALFGMGTTATALLFHEGEAFIGHVGDSRAYLMREGRLLQLTEDHSLVNEQLKAGLISQKEAQKSRFRNIITRSIGFEEDVDVDMVALKVAPDDTFILCTDGLTCLVSDEEIFQVLTSCDLDESPQILIDLANKRGGDDNITIIIVRIYIKELSGE
jgi:serine/threonine protein phosphatase PrpC